MSGFKQALPFVLGKEGGVSNDPDDSGGLTNQGVTQAAYDAYRDRKGLAHQSVRFMTTDERDALYFEDYWLAGKCDAMPWPVSLLHFDAMVQHRPSAAWRIMQRAIGVTADGKPGPQTMAALQRMDAEDLARRWFRERASFYLAIAEAEPVKRKFLRGWINNRVLDLKDEARRLA